MEVQDPFTGQMVTVPMRRDLPGYHVTRARKSPRMRWSLPVDIQWQSECIMKFLGQSCACCDIISGRPDKENENQSGSVKHRSRGHDTVIVDTNNKERGKMKKGGKIEETTTTVDYSYKFSPDNAEDSDMMSSHLRSEANNDVTKDIKERLSLESLGMLPGFPVPPKSMAARKNRRRKHLISTTEMLIPQAEKSPGNPLQTPFDVMQSHILPGRGTVDDSHTVSNEQPSLLNDILEEGN